MRLLAAGIVFDEFAKEVIMSLLPNRQPLFDELFRDFAPGFFIRPLHGEALPSQIKMDVREDGDRFVVHAELPGVNKDDVHVEIDGPIVTLRAELRQHDAQTKDERLLRSERYYGAVSRSFQLPADVDNTTASAKLDNGVLTLTLPKRRETPSAKRLQID
jgi:HSP20 family protein